MQAADLRVIRVEWFDAVHIRDRYYGYSTSL